MVLISLVKDDYFYPQTQDIIEMSSKVEVRSLPTLLQISSVIGIATENAVALSLQTLVSKRLRASG